MNPQSPDGDSSFGKGAFQALFFKEGGMLCMPGDCNPQSPDGDSSFGKGAFEALFFKEGDMLCMPGD